LVVLAEKVLVRRDGYDRAHAEQELEDVGPDSAENRHALQEVDARFWHDDTSEVAVMIGPQGRAMGRRGQSIAEVLAAGVSKAAERTPRLTH
jgi:hypothetical protein